MNIGILWILQIIFITLKCVDMIEWTWAKVFIPAYIWLALAMLYSFITAIIDTKKYKKY